MKHTLSGAKASDAIRSAPAKSSPIQVPSELFSDWLCASNKPMLIARSDMTIGWTNKAAQKILNDGDVIAQRNGKLTSPLIDLRSEIQSGIYNEDATIVALPSPEDAMAIRCVLRVRALADREGTLFFGILIGDPRINV